MDYIIVIGLVLGSGLFSGLTIGLMSLSKQDLEMAADLGNSDAKKVLNIIKDSNLLLVTLLLGNTAINATLSIFMGSIVGAGFIAGLVSTIIILIFGEILPASILSKHALKVGSLTSGLVSVFLKVFYPITKPIAMTLDKFVGVDGDEFFSKKEFVYMLGKHQESDESDIDELDNKTIKGALLLSEKNAGDHMSQNIFSLTSSTIINLDILEKIKEEGFTRIPIIDDGTCSGIINVKDFLALDINEEVSIKDFIRNDKVVHFSYKMHLDDILSDLMRKKAHMAIITAFDNIIVGVLTLEDILEEILLSEIVDEFD